MVTAAIRAPAVRRLQESADLVGLEVLDNAQARPLEGHGEKSLAELEVLGVPSGGEARKSVDCGQAGVASCGVVVAIGLQMMEEREEVVGRESVEVQINDRTPAPRCEETQVQRQRVAVAPHGVRAGTADLGQVIREELAKRTSQGIGLRGLHRSLPPTGTRESRWLQCLANRSLAAWATGSRKAR